MFFINHFAYLSVGRFDYQYNMKANILTGKYLKIYMVSEVYEKKVCYLLNYFHFTIKSFQNKTVFSWKLQNNISQRLSVQSRSNFEIYWNIL